MGTMSSRRWAAGGFGLAAFACAASLTVAGQAVAATATYPSGGSDFDSGTQGWEGSQATCTPNILLVISCSSANEYSPDAGNPGGSIATTAEVTLNAGQVFSATGTWTSPPFEVTAKQPVTAGTFSFDRRVESDGLLGVNLNPSSGVVVSLVDETAGTTLPVLTETLTEANATFATGGVGLATGGLVDGHSYRLRIVTTTTSTLLTAVGTVAARFDNVALTVQTGGGGGGPNTGGELPVGTPGVTIVKSSLTNSEIARLIGRFGINADVGKGTGGSLVPLAACTVIGTAGSDRILGSRGNDVICGLGGNDVVIGGGGRDLVDGANGADRLGGGAGGDLLLGLRGNDRLTGGAGRDGIGGGAGRDVLRGGSGRDRLSARKGADRLYTRDGVRDSVVGGPGRDVGRVDKVAGSSKRAARRADRVRGIERLR
jgi:Ca2+-binding RTX toxin-like protein